MNNEEKQKQKLAAAQSAVENWSLEFNLITPEFLQKMRLALLVVFPYKQVDVSCDVNKFKMTWEVKFDTIKTLFKNKSKILNKTKSILEERFPGYDIEVKEF
jgi:hypothetical protein